MALHANRSDILNVVVRVSAARRPAAGVRILLTVSAQGVFFRFSFGGPPREPGILLALH